MAQAKVQSSPKAQTPRPLSPHLQVYRWTWTMAMSIAHRVTGVALYVGTVLLAFWFLAMASGADGYANAEWLFGSIIGYLILFGYSWALLHHMLGGIRHFLWDFGIGYDYQQRMMLARGTLIGSAALTVLLWIVVLIVR